MLQLSHKDKARNNNELHSQIMLQITYLEGGFLCLCRLVSCSSFSFTVLSQKKFNKKSHLKKTNKERKKEKKIENERKKEKKKERKKE